MANAKNFVQVDSYIYSSWTWKWLTCNASAKYFRFVMTKITDYRTPIGELELFDQNHNLIPKSTYVVSAGSANGIHPPEAVIDGEPGELGYRAWSPDHLASYDSPNTLMVALSSQQLISAIATCICPYNWGNGGDMQIQEFYIQFSNDPTCLYSDPVDSPKWFGVDLKDGDYVGEKKWNATITNGSGGGENPFDLTAVAGKSSIILEWDEAAGATGYNVKRATTAGGAYVTIASNIANNYYIDSDVAGGITYYYVLTAITADGESDPSNEASAVISDEPVEKKNAILRVTMTDSSEREYKVAKEEAAGFVGWMSRAVGTGTAVYALNKAVTESKEYLVFDKIISFEVREVI